MRRTLTIAAAVVALALPGGLALAQETGPDTEACTLAQADVIRLDAKAAEARVIALATPGVDEADLTQAEVDRLAEIVATPDHPNAEDAQRKLDVIRAVLDAAADAEAAEAERDKACEAPAEDPADDQPPADDPADEGPADTDDRVCSDFATQAEAQAAYEFGNRALDADGDRIACEDEFADSKIIDLQDDDQVDVIPSGAPETGGR